MLNFHQLIWPAIILLAACHNNNAPNPAAQTTPAATPSAAPSAAPITPAAAPSATAASPRDRRIVFFGNSLTAGYGLSPEEAFPALIAHRLDSLRLPYKVINAGVSGETSAGGLNRIGWTLRQPVDIFVLELGANDGLRGIPVAATTANLQSIIDSVRQKYPAAKIVLAGMQIPPTMGDTYAAGFRALFRQLAEKNNTALIPFLLQGVASVPALNQPDGIHPTAEGAKIVAENVWKILQPLL